MEMRVSFTLSGKDYCLFIERGLLRIKRITLLQICKGDPMGSARQIPIKISANTLKDSWDNWLINVILYLSKQRRKQRGQRRRGNTRKCSGRNFG